MGQLFDSLVSRLQEFFDPQMLGTILAEIVVNVIIVALVLSLFYLVWWLVKRLAVSRLSARLDKTSAAFAETALRFGILAIGLLTALSATGFDTTTLLGSLGIVGLTLGFALRDTLSNIVAGILIFIDRPFTIDDLVEIEGKYGRVDKISLRTTRIITNDGKMLAVPNSEVMNKTVASYTNFPHLRLDIGVTVAVTEDIDQVRDILLSLVSDTSRYLSNPAPRVVVTALNDYNIALELQVWIRDERAHVVHRFALREDVFKALTRANIDMPFETIQLAPHRVIGLSPDSNSSTDDSV